MAVAPSFQFINLNVNDQTEAAARRNKKIARSHTGRVNRRRYLASTQSQQRSSDATLTGGSSSTTHQDQVPQPIATSDDPEPERPEDGTTELVVSRPVSPAFATHVASTFVPGVQRAPEETIRYFFRYVLANFMTYDEMSWHFQKFCTTPLVFHAVHYSAANHQDRLRGVISSTRSLATISHKVQAIRLVNDAINDLASADFSALLLAMTCLMRNEPEEDQLQADRMLLFNPHMPTVNGVNVYGRGRMVQQINPVHREALITLVERAGGPRSVECYGLMKALAGHDLIVSSQEGRRPRAVNIWADKDLISYVLRAHSSSIGRGFNDSIPGGLPEAALSAVTYISATDQALSRHRGRNLSDDDGAKLRAVINDAHWRIMALTPWNELSEDARGTSHFATYECCRLTAMLYSNSVLFPLPTASSWHIDLLLQIRRILAEARLQLWPDDAGALLIWSLCIASIAAFWTDHKMYFIRELESALLAKGVASWSAFHAILKRFLWTDIACWAGGMDVWKSLQMNRWRESVAASEV